MMPRRGTACGPATRIGRASGGGGGGGGGEGGVQLQRTNYERAGVAGVVGYSVVAPEITGRARNCDRK